MSDTAKWNTLWFSLPPVAHCFQNFHEDTSPQSVQVGCCSLHVARMFVCVAFRTFFILFSSGQFAGITYIDAWETSAYQYQYFAFAAWPTRFPFNVWRSMMVLFVCGRRIRAGLYAFTFECDWSFSWHTAGEHWHLVPPIGWLRNTSDPHLLDQIYVPSMKKWSFCQKSFKLARKNNA